MSTARGIGAYDPARGQGSGVASEDYGGDGDIDLFVPQRSGVADQLYRNLGNGSFEEIAARVGLDSTEPSRAALWLDYDGDGDLDLVVAVWAVAGTTASRIYRNDAGGFVDVTAASGTQVSNRSGSR